MKELYEKPTMVLIEIEPVEMLAVSSVGYTTEKASNEFEALSNKRRGGWGNLWEDDK